MKNEFEGLIERKCTGCNLWLTQHEFPRDRTQATGRSSRCKKCKNDALRLREANRRAAHNDLPRSVCTYEADREKTLTAANDWRGPVNDGPLVPALGMPVMGMREAA